MALTKASVDANMVIVWNWLQQAKSLFGGQSPEARLLERSNQRLAKAWGLIYLAMGWSEKK